MMSICHNYELANESFSVCARPVVHTDLAMFLRSASDKDGSFFNIDIHLVEDRKQFFDIVSAKLQTNELFTVFTLKNMQYSYNGKNGYYALGSGIFGIISISDKRAEWFICNKKIRGRNIFHICVLDVLSLVLPSVNKIVFHGAALKIKDGASLLLGRSTSGKSTVSHRLRECCPEYEKICDDTFVLTVGKTSSFLSVINTGEGYTYETAERLVNEYGYKYLYRAVEKEKDYVIKEDQYTPVLPVKRIIFLRRTTDASLPHITKIQKCPRSRVLTEIIDAQTNIATPYLKKQVMLYQCIAQNIPGYFVSFNFDCDILRLKEEIFDG